MTDKEMMTRMDEEMDKRFDSLKKDIMEAINNVKNVPETPEVQPEQAAQAEPKQVNTPPQPVQVQIPIPEPTNTTPRSKLKTAGLILGITAALGAIGYGCYKIGTRNSGGNEYGYGGCDPIGPQQPQLGMNPDPYVTSSYDDNGNDRHVGIGGLDSDGFLID